MSNDPGARLMLFKSWRQNLHMSVIDSVTLIPTRYY